MLLFIKFLPVAEDGIDMRFNTSHVTLYQHRRLSNTKPVRVSIHHMLLFILTCAGLQGILFLVSIHHMLLFIENQHRYLASQNKFQYITCYSLSGNHKKEKRNRLVSIHHMLLFIGITYRLVVMVDKFQYITCYSLSLG